MLSIQPVHAKVEMLNSRISLDFLVNWGLRHHHFEQCPGLVTYYY